MKNKHIIIAGGGHSGIEAALAISRMDQKATIITLDPNAIGRMSCNPAVGGLAKGHLVKEIDALGGIMGLAADHAGIQFKTLNKSKGRAVWSPRAQVDKKNYPLGRDTLHNDSFKYRDNYRTLYNNLIDSLKKKQILHSHWLGSISGGPFG